MEVLAGRLETAKTVGHTVTIRAVAAHGVELMGTVVVGTSMMRMAIVQKKWKKLFLIIHRSINMSWTSVRRRKVAQQ